MLKEEGFVEWMTGKGYPIKTPRTYLKDIGKAQVRLGAAMEPASIKNTGLILLHLGNEAPTRTSKQIKNDQSAVNCYHEFSTGVPLTGYRRRGPRNPIK